MCQIGDFIHATIIEAKVRKTEIIKYCEIFSKRITSEKRTTSHIVTPANFSKKAMTKNDKQTQLQIQCCHHIPIKSQLLQI